MRTFVVALALVLVTAPTAAAKSGSALSTPPDGLHAGQPWDVDIAPIRGDRPARLARNAHVAIEIEKLDTGETRVVRARPLRNGAFRAHVVFASRGQWRYRVTGLRSDGQEWPTVSILPAESAGARDSDAAQESASGFPFGWVAAGLALVAVVSGMLYVRRRHS
jgi:hypothetical protein